MHPEIEKLIDLALEDGQISEKEREIILRKAEKLGEDVDFVEMYIENRLSKLQKTELNLQENVESFGIIDFDYSPYYEERDGYTKKDIEDDLSVFKSFLTDELKIEIERFEYLLDANDKNPDEDDTCIIRFFVDYKNDLEELVKKNKTKIELFSSCPWKDNRKDCFYPYVSISMVNYQKEFIHELGKTMNIWQWERVKSSLITITEGLMD